MRFLRTDKYPGFDFPIVAPQRDSGTQSNRFVASFALDNGGALECLFELCEPGLQDGPLILQLFVFTVVRNIPAFGSLLNTLMEFRAAPIAQVLQLVVEPGHSRFR
jgi:hypothetical protein